MIYVFIAVVIFILLFVIGRKFLPVLSKPNTKIIEAELITTVLTLDEKSFSELIELYQKEFGAGAAKYARRTYRKWKTREVYPSGQTFRRFLIHLPKVMSYDLKCEVLRRLMEEYCPRQD